MSAFQGKTIWITGASSGIGEALALALATQGARLILSGRRLEALQGVAAHCAPTATLVLPFEATDFDRLPSIVAQAQEWAQEWAQKDTKMGGIDMLINNAGISQRSLAVDTEFSVYRQLFEVDFFAAIRLTQLVLPAMLQAGQGHLVAIASVAGKVGAPKRTGYCAAKHAIVGYFDALRAETARHGLHVSVVTPGFIRTNIAKNALTGAGVAQQHNDKDIEAGMDPNACARVIVAGLARRQKEIAVGQGKEMAALWLKRFFPERLFALAARMQ
jgi:short-subunit dehydrogenase